MSGIQFSRFWWLLVLVAVGVIHTARGGDAPSIEPSFVEANKLYEQGRHAEAATNYAKLLPAGRHPVILYNLGNAWWKAGQRGKALAAFRDAEKSIPRDRDLRQNLDQLLTQTGTSARVGVHWADWTNRLTLNEWAWLAVIPMSAWFTLLTLAQWKPDLRRNFRGYTGTLGLLTVVLVTSLGVALHRRLVVKTCAVTTAESPVRRGPMSESQTYFTANDGTEFIVTAQRPGWWQVRDTSGRLGWIEESRASRIY